MMEIMIEILIQNPLICALCAGLLMKFIWGRANSKTGVSTGEGETYLTPEEQINLAELTAQSKGGKDIRVIEKRDGFDMTYEEPDGSLTGLSIRRKKDE